MSYKGHYAAKRKALGWKKITLIVVAVVLVLVLGIGIAAVSFWYDTIDQINKAEGLENTLSQEEQQQLMDQFTINNDDAVDSTDPTDELATGPDDYITNNADVINILLIGQDIREGQTWKLSDSMILCTIDPNEKTMVMTSFLRDMYVKLPNYMGHTCGYNRINVCYSLGYSWNGTIGAMEMLDQCLLENFGVQVDYNVEVDFTAFEKIVNLMDGVDIELTKAEASHLNKNNGWKLSEGVNHLDGEQALAYARIRKIDNDFYRTNRQRTVIYALLEKCRSLSLSQLNSLLKTVLPLITTDMDSNQITEYALQLLPLVADLEVTSQAIPAEGCYYYANKGTEEEPMEVIIPNLEKNRAILEDTIGG